MTHLLHPSHRKHNVSTARIGARLRSRLCMALSAALLLPAMDAAAGQFEYIGVQVPVAASYNPYTANIYEWRHTNGVARSLPSHCNASTAPIVVLFHGGNGVDANNATLTWQMTTLAQRLSQACVRMVAIQGITPMDGGAPKSNYVRDNTTFTAYNMARALQLAMSSYPSTTNAALFSGSNGGITASALMYNYFYSYTNDASAPWKKLDRFVLNVPAGNVYSTCTPYQTTTPFYLGFTNFSTCAALIAQPDALNRGLTATPFTGSQITAFRNKAQLHLLVGSADDVVAPYTGNQGIENYLSSSNLGPYTTRVTDTLPPSSSRITFTTITGAGHSNLWNYNDAAETRLCRLMARKFNNGDSTPSVDTRPSTVDNNCDSATYNPGSIVGIVDSSAPGGIISGWACAYGSPISITTHLYVGGPAGAGTLLTDQGYGFKANKSSEPAVAAACGSTGTAYRFRIVLTPADRLAHRNKAIYLYGIHPVNSALNSALTRGNGSLAVVY